MGQPNVQPGHVFVSYVREDSGEVDALQRALERAGVPVWRDTEDLWPGEDWREKISREIASNALVFIACFSRRSLARTVSYQYEELALAIEQLRLRRPDVPWLIPVRFDDCQIPELRIGEGRTLASIQRVDLFGDGAGKAGERLIRAIHRIFGQHIANLDLGLAWTQATGPARGGQVPAPGTGPEAPQTRAAAVSGPSGPVRAERQPEALASKGRQGSGGKASGELITFYSGTGGTGSTLTLANVAWILAANGGRVLAADWHLESPGLDRAFRPFLPPDAADKAGVIDLIRRYERKAPKPGHRIPAEMIAEFAEVEKYVLPLNWDFPCGGQLDYLPAGRQNVDYAARLASLDWDNFYERLWGGAFLDALGASMRRHYDYVLIDSPPGLSDIAGACTVQLPDTVAVCFNMTSHSMEQAARVARLIQKRHADRMIRILPVPSHIDRAEPGKAAARLSAAIRIFGGLPAGISEAERIAYWAAAEIPYRAYYSYGHILAVFADAPGNPATLLSAFERLTAQITCGVITGLAPMDDQIRQHVMSLFDPEDDS